MSFFVLQSSAYSNWEALNESAINCSVEKSSVSDFVAYGRSLLVLIFVMVLLKKKLVISLILKKLILSRILHNSKNNFLMSLDFVLVSFFILSLWVAQYPMSFWKWLAVKLNHPGQLVKFWKQSKIMMAWRKYLIVGQSDSTGSLYRSTNIVNLDLYHWELWKD